MQIGFAKVDITPRVGVELCGFGPYLNRHSITMRDRLWARAMAVRQGETTLLLVSCDLLGLEREVTSWVRALVREATGIPEAQVMVHCIHTHSGPNTLRALIGWGVADAPYLEVLPGRIAQACINAVGNLTEATLAHAEVPCDGIGMNREYDKDALPLEEVLRDDWRPEKPELTDTTCHVLTAHAGDRLLGFASYFGCHPVVCCSETRYLHGDYAGVATNLLECEHPGAVGLFLQGAQGDVNSCVVHKPEQESLLALDIIAARYANAVREGMRQATPLNIDNIAAARQDVTFSRETNTMDELYASLAEQEKVLHATGASDTDFTVRMATVYAIAYRNLLHRLQHGESINQASETQAFRIGPLALLGAPFEIFQAIKNDVQASALSPIPLVMSFTNDYLGYAPDRDTADRGGYAARQVPLMISTLPFSDIHGELVQALLAVEREVV